ncbi:MAG: hypothetical protein WAX77_14350 [Methylococcaceae bacterium]
MLEKKYPNIADWIDRHGSIELGQNDYSDSMVRVLDEGGTVWESEEDYNSLDDLFNALEAELAEFIKERDD